MGLGKTVQAVAFLALLKHLEKDPGPHLIVAPASLLDNWQRELNKWCPSFNVALFHGNERASLIRDLQAQKKAGVELPFNVMLTCYTLFERRSAQQKDDRVFLRSWNWSCVMMDEAHFLKDKGSLRTRRLRELAHKAKQRVMLTGTPLQNDLQELWALLEFLLPDIFSTGKVDLSKVLGGRSTTASVLQEDRDLIAQIKAILGPFVLRRMKADVTQQLVPKIHKVECVDMVPEQALAYKENVMEYRELALATRAGKSSNASAMDVLPKQQMHNIFTQRRKIERKVLKKKSEVEEEKLGSKTTALPLKKKSISAEIDEIFGNKKRKVVIAESGDSAVATLGKKTKVKGAEVAVHGQRSSDKSPSASRGKPRKKTLDGFTVYSEDEIGWNKKNAGGTPLCPFDCECCF